jgi:hypothetical protein
MAADLHVVAIFGGGHLINWANFVNFTASSVCDLHAAIFNTKWKYSTEVLV